MSEEPGHGLDGHVAHSLGRIEEILNGVREDLQASAVELKEMSRHMIATDGRIQSLETWRDALANYDKEKIERAKNRGRFAAGMVTVMAIPTLGWVIGLSEWVHRVHQSLPPRSGTSPRP